MDTNNLHVFQQIIITISKDLYIKNNKNHKINHVDANSNQFYIYLELWLVKFQEKKKMKDISKIKEKNL